MDLGPITREQSMDDTRVPAVPKSIEETGLDEAFLLDLALKHVYFGSGLQAIDLAPTLPALPLGILIEYQLEKSFGDPDLGQDVLAHHVGGGEGANGRLPVHLLLTGQAPLGAGDAALALHEGEQVVLAFLEPRDVAEGVVG